MKFTASLVALFVLCQEAAAFQVATPAKATTALKAEPAATSLSRGVRDYTPASGGAVANIAPVNEIWDSLVPVKVQGGSLRTWSITNEDVERVQVLMKTEGRPLNANIELWQGPDNTPQKLGIYIEDGNLRPFSAVIETPRSPNAVAIYNTAHLEFPLDACVEADLGDGTGVGSIFTQMASESVPKTVQGGAIFTTPFAPSVASVQVMLKTDGRPLNARIELLQGPNNNKQVMEVYTEDGLERPFFAVLETPGSGNVVRIVNTATVEFPLIAYVEPYLVEPGSRADNFRISEDGTESMNRFFFLN